MTIIDPCTAGRTLASSILQQAFMVAFLQELLPFLLELYYRSLIKSLLHSEIF